MGGNSIRYVKMKVRVFPLLKSLFYLKSFSDRTKFLSKLSCFLANIRQSIAQYKIKCAFFSDLAILSNLN